MDNPILFLKSLFENSLKIAKPEMCIPKNLPNPCEGRNIVIGAGKASAKMASVLENNWNTKIEGLVITKYGHKVKCKSIEIILELLKFLDIYCDQLPGAAPKSTTKVLFLIILNFLSISCNL